MNDLEKVIRGLEICKADLWSRETCKITGCPYADIPDGTTEYKSCRIKMMTDALSLLKAQEPKPVELYGKDDWYGLVCVCPDCKAEWMSDESNTHFCPNCGNAVKWND